MTCPALVVIFFFFLLSIPSYLFGFPPNRVCTLKRWVKLIRFALPFLFYLTVKIRKLIEKVFEVKEILIYDSTSNRSSKADRKFFFCQYLHTNAQIWRWEMVERKKKSFAHFETSFEDNELAADSVRFNQNSSSANDSSMLKICWKIMRKKVYRQMDVSFPYWSHNTFVLPVDLLGFIITNFECKR